MNIARLIVTASLPTARMLMQRALEPHLLIGMPHLTPNGLSETWLMKELGHRHWLMLAQQLGMDNADFRTGDGQVAYAAICATSLRGARFDAVRANDILTITSGFSRVGRTQASTTHILTIAGTMIGEVELISTFVHRQVCDDNHSIVRVALVQDASSFHPNPLAQAAAEIRNGRRDRYREMPVDSTRSLRNFAFTASPSQDFNGAGLLYFANFQSLVDRAVESWFPNEPRVCKSRDVFFTGNVRKGEQLQIELASVDPAKGTMACRISRSDGRTIARLFMEMLSDKDGG
jgi:probable biosynthetic protein (TIGR04099 family)